MRVIIRVDQFNSDQLRRPIPDNCNWLRHSDNQRNGVRSGRQESHRRRVDRFCNQLGHRPAKPMKTILHSIAFLSFSFCVLAQFENPEFVASLTIANPVSSTSLISTNTNPWVYAASVPPAWSGGSSFPGNNTVPGRTLAMPGGGGIISKGGADRFRLSGTAYAASCSLLTTGANHLIRFKVLRSENITTNIYDLVGQSEVFTNLIVGSNYFVFANPIKGIIEGDVPSIFLTNGNPSTAIVEATSGNGTYYVNADATGTGIFLPTGAGPPINLTFWVSAPIVAYTGDSIMAGHNNGGTTSTPSTNYWCPFLDGQLISVTTGGKTNASIPIMASTNGEGLVTYCNYAKGSQTFRWVVTNSLSNFTNDSPRVLWIHCGINDVSTSRLWSDVLTDLNSIRAVWPQTNPMFMTEIDRKSVV